ncbi:hypothetical protein CMQ_2103 [Grosmannia clavigera kw1407]|uniref:Lipid droplet-associated hydrolase n=1 Tax=Grosmannia clavigera (strain kw1407 / UAMH 11150) TaxID=655863 RepID=F0XJT6_GROCL|nr:uncharacterized protein CMQ_2103 [Grosmannia clavigera kw1407]EFX02054.1 hypothetical protein CMQ_2103 [Grosmannia clavigera kw1407]
MPVWLSYPSSRKDSGETAVKHCLFYLIPGNPGFIEYYATFLSALRGLLDEIEDKSSIRFTILGRNLLGFDDGDNGDDGSGSYGLRPFDLDTQIQAAMDAIAAARIDTNHGPRHGEPFDEVFLSGHSVGSYIALEVFRRHQELMKQPTTSAATGVSHLRLRAGFLLFATLTHLAKSPSGRNLERLLNTPLLGPCAPWLAERFLACWPTWALGWIVGSVLQFPPHAASVTTRFLSSYGGVRQALYLGGDELVNIGEDEWADEVWELAQDSGTGRDTEKQPTPKFVILFGQNDHWVANEYRDRFIARRAEHALRDEPLHKRGRAQIVMDEKGLPHAFCLRHGEEVAEMVRSWISDIIEDF